MANKHMKRCSTLVKSNQMQIKTTMRYHFMQVRMAVIQKSMRTHPSHGRKATGNTQGTRDNVARFPGKHHLAGHPPWALKREVDGCCVCESCSVMPDSLRLHGILQARILEWVAFPFSRGPSQLRNRPGVSCIAGGFLTS